MADRFRHATCGSAVVLAVCLSMLAGCGSSDGPGDPGNPEIAGRISRAPSPSEVAEAEPLDIFDDDVTLDWLLEIEPSASTSLAVRAALKRGCVKTDVGHYEAELRSTAAAVLVAAALDGRGTGNPNADDFLAAHVLEPGMAEISLARAALACGREMATDGGYWADTETLAEVQRLLDLTAARLR